MMLYTIFFDQLYHHSFLLKLNLNHPQNIGFSCQITINYFFIKFYY